jgi:hypothetical protein
MEFLDFLPMWSGRRLVRAQSKALKKFVLDYARAMAM